METERVTTVEDAGTGGPETARSTKSLATPFGVDETAELVLDLLGHTALIAPDVLALVCGRAARGTPVTQALEGRELRPLTAWPACWRSATTFSSSISRA